MFVVSIFLLPYSAFVELQDHMATSKRLFQIL